MARLFRSTKMSHSHSPSRRRLLKQTFAFTATSLLGLGTRFVTAEEASAEDHHLLMVGDWGMFKDIKPQQAVANGMKTYVESLKFNPEAMLMLGDNFYGAFPGGLKDPRWKEQFEDMYLASSFPGPCYALLGNHDYDDEPKIKLEAQLAYTKANPGTRWTMPSKWYAFDYPTVNPLVKFIALDSNYKNRVESLTPEEIASQLEWFKAELAKPRTAPYLVVMAHHPLYTNGVHGDDQALIKDWDQLLRDHKAHFYFCGHDHDLQHMEFEGHPTSFVISGGGGARVREIKELRHGPFGIGIYGFSHLQINKDRLIVRHLDANRKQLHALSKTPDGKMTILS